jgi:hypothetical protein
VALLRMCVSLSSSDRLAERKAAAYPKHIIIINNSFIQDLLGKKKFCLLFSRRLPQLNKTIHGNFTIAVSDKRSFVKFDIGESQDL